MKVNKISPFLGICIKRLERQRTIGKQHLVKEILVHNRLAAKNIHTSIGHIQSLRLVGSKIKGLPEILVGIALRKVYPLNPDIRPMIKLHHSVPPILRQ